MMYEMEDGRTPSDGQVRYGFDDNVFRGYSWRGYAIYSRLQVRVFIVLMNIHVVCINYHIEYYPLWPL